MVSKKSSKATASVAPVDGGTQPQTRRVAQVTKAGAALGLTTTDQALSESKSTAWTEAAQAAKTIGKMFGTPSADADILARIQARSEHHPNASVLGSARLVAAYEQHMAKFDLADLQQITEASGLQRFAAVTIADNMDKYPDYKAGVSRLDAQHPGLLNSIADFNKVNNAMIAAKETRKSAEFQSMIVGSTANGVLVNAVDGGYEVSFPFDRQLATMIDRVPNAVFNKEKKVYQVPSGSAAQLDKVVAAMRIERHAIETDFESILALATATGIEAQKGVGTGSGVVPQLSSFIEPGKAHRGEIVNANSRFVAQLTGFGKQDNAAFLTIHRLASLDNDKLFKGDKVAITYDGKFRGAVTDLSRNRSVAELAADYEINLGNKIDGVTVSDRGAKIGVAFEINPNMISRIRRVEGAAFIKEDKVWEIPKAKQEFALFAVQDLRNEFVVDARDVTALRQVAESKIDGAKVRPAFTKDGHEYFGTVLAVGDRYALQNSGRGNFTLHHLSALDQKPINGHNLDIRYNLGVGYVRDKDQQRGQDRGR